MFFRFGSAVLLVVLISLVGIAIEKQNLQHRRELSRRHFQMDVLRDEHTRLRLRCQSLASIERLFETIDGLNVRLTPYEFRPVVPANEDDGSSNDQKQERKTKRRVPLLFFQEPLHDPGTMKKR